MKNQISRKHYFGLSAITTICFMCFTGCIPNSDSTEDLSGQYFYREEGTHVKDILSYVPNRKEIYSEIVHYDFNPDFIIAEQKPIYNEYKAMIGFNLRANTKKYPTNSETEVIQSEKEADSILKNDPYYKSILAHKINYWIIVISSNQMLGPLTKQEYEKKRKELNIPGRLGLK